MVYTDVTNPADTITASIVPNPVDPAAVIHWNEDQNHLVIDFHSNDEEVQSPAFPRDAYYSVDVTGPTGQHFVLNSNGTVNSTLADLGSMPAVSSTTSRMTDQSTGRPTIATWASDVRGLPL